MTGHEGHGKAFAARDPLQVSNVCALTFLLGYACGLAVVVPILLLRGARDPEADHE